MSSEPSFDPYQQWLQIPPHERPLDHDRLLGTPRFETDPAVIMNAADNRMALVRQYQTGPRGKYTQKVLNEIAAARVVLLNPQSKSNYDEALKSRLANSAAMPAGAPVSAAMPIQPYLAPASSPPPPAPPATPPELTNREPTWATDDDDHVDADPFYATAWFPILIACLVLAGAGIAWGIAKYRARSATVASLPAGEPSSGEVSADDVPTPPGAAMVHGTEHIHCPPAVAPLHGSTITRASQNDAEVIANWSAVEDWVQWEFRVVKPGFFKVEIVYAAGDAAGSAELSIDNERAKSISFRSSQPPGTWITDFYFLPITRSGQHTLYLRPQSIPGAELITLKSIHFVPHNAG
mgnify:CR=1 FL=1